MRASLFTLVLFAIALFTSAAVAQPRHFETLDLALAGVAPLGETYDGLWTAEPGAVLLAGTEFYGGQAHVSLLAFSNTPASIEQPEFLALHGSIGWGVALPLPAHFRITGGGTAGAVHFRFDGEDDRFPGALQNETELTAGLFARAERRLLGPVHVFLGAEIARVYTAEPIVYRRLQGGLSFRTPMPAAIGRFFQ